MCEMNDREVWSLCIIDVEFMSVSHVEFMLISFSKEMIESNQSDINIRLTDVSFSTPVRLQLSIISSRFV